MASEEDKVNWKERCQALEGSLLRFKGQASQVRQILAQKMSELEITVKKANSRAEKAEEQNKMLEQRLASMNWQPAEADRRLHELEMSCREKDKIVTVLENQLREQKQLRSQETKAVEDKCAKVRECVTKRMRELELQNQQFRLETDTLRDQIEILRARLHSLPAGVAKELHRLSEQEPLATSSRPESQNSTPPPPEIPQRPASSILENFRREQELTQVPSENEESAPFDTSPETDNMAGATADDEDDDFEPLYQEIDDNHESKYEPKRMAPPQIKIERKVFQNSHLQHCSMVSSTNGSEEMLETQQVYTLPRRRLASTSSALDTTQASPPMLTPRSPPPKMTPFTPLAPPNSPSPYGGTHSSQTVSALATLPRRKKDQKFSPPYYKDGKGIPGTQTIGGSHMLEECVRRRMSAPKPPTPPMRRLPSWENRIYAIASTGMKMPELGFSPNHRDSALPVTDGLYTDQMYQDLTVPVYTTLKGKAAQIRSTPFTGESSSDSSDNDESRVAISPVSESEAVMTVAGPTGSKTTTSVTVRKQINQTSSGATKRAVSSQSIGSETSSDYAVPPDEVSIQTDSSDSLEPEHKLLKYASEHKKDSLEKSGYLTKLGGKVKNWKRRWFVLKNGELLYYKTPNDIARKPQGHISLDGQTRINRSEGALTFELVTGKRTYYLTAECAEDMDHWIRVLQNVLKKQAADQVFKQTHAKEVMKGWLIKTKHGRSRRCYCVLVGKFFMYYKMPTDKTPLGQLHLRDARVEEVDRSCDSETDSDDTSIPDYTLAVWPTHQGPTYLMLPTKHEKDSWLYHLTVASGGGMGNVGTQYEQLISKLMEVDGDPGSVYWKHPCLLHTKEPLEKPLTTLPSEELQEKAVELFKSCHLFMSMAIDSPHLDYHVTLAQNILHTCIQHPELQNELYCQLIKQSSRHPVQHKSGVQNLLLCGGSHSWFLCDASPTSPTTSMMDLSDSKLNPVNYVFLQCWQLLAMCVSLFLPRQSILWYLKAHLQRNADPRTDTGKYAVFCQRTVERAMHNGGREARPSRMEVLSILLRNPYHHSQPISIPVHFLNGTYQVVSFDGSTTVQEFVQSLNKAINMRDCALSGFALFTDDPAGQGLEHCLKGHLKLGDVISKWEQAFLHHHHGRPDSSRTVKLVYKNRLYFKSLSKSETEKERHLLACQVNDEIVNGRFPVNRELAVEMAALMAQMEFGDFKLPGESSSFITVAGRSMSPPSHSAQQVTTALERFFPKRYRELGPDDLRVLQNKVTDKWLALRGRSIHDCVRIYLTVARKWPFFGAKLFPAQVKYSGPNSANVWLAVQEDGVSILEYATLKPVTKYVYPSVVTFGGCREDFMLVVTHQIQNSSDQQETRTDRLLFVMAKPKQILEITMLIASYINSKRQQRPTTASTFCESKSQTLSRQSEATLRSITMEV